MSTRFISAQCERLLHFAVIYGCAKFYLLSSDMTGTHNFYFFPALWKSDVFISQMMNKGIKMCLTVKHETQLLLKKHK